MGFISLIIIRMGAKSSKHLQKLYSQEIYCPFQTIKSNGMNPTVKFQAPKNFSPEKGGSESEPSQKSITNIYVPQPNTTKLEQGIENYPACSVGFIQSWFGAGYTSNGSGFMVYRNLVMTCAHHVFNLQTSSPAKEVNFYLGRFRNQGKLVKVLKIYYPQEYSQAKDPKTRFLWDFGMLQLAEDVHQQFGYLGLSFDDSDIGSHPKSIYGYPYNFEQIEPCRYEGKCSSQEGIIKHNFPTEIGVDGGPIGYQTSKYFRVVGIHQGNYLKDARAVKLRFEIYQKIRFWLSEKRGTLNLSKMAVQRAKLKVYRRKLEKSMLRRPEYPYYEAGTNAVHMILKANWANLITLNISENNLGNSGLKLLSQGAWPRLSSLNLSFTCISSEGVEHMQSSVWKNLECLALCDNNIMALGVKSLVECNWKNLKELSLSGNNIGTKGSMQLSKSNWKSLEKLVLEKCFLESEGLFWLTKADWKKLKSLNIAKNNIGDHGIKMLQDSHWVFLEQLNIDQNKVSSQGFKTLSQVHWKCLRHLSVRQNGIDGAGFFSIVRSDWRRLQCIDARWNAANEEDIATLKQVLMTKLVRLKTLDF